MATNTFLLASPLLAAARKEADAIRRGLKGIGGSCSNNVVEAQNGKVFLKERSETRKRMIKEEPSPSGASGKRESFLSRIDSILSLEASQTKSKLKEDVCPICLDEIEDRIACKACLKPFCRTCLLQSLVATRNTCPCCRYADPLCFSVEKQEDAEVDDANMHATYAAPAHIHRRRHEPRRVIPARSKLQGGILVKVAKLNFIVLSSHWIYVDFSLVPSELRISFRGSVLLVIPMHSVRCIKQSCAPSSLCVREYKGKMLFSKKQCPPVYTCVLEERSRRKHNTWKHLLQLAFFSAEDRDAFISKC